MKQPRDQHWANLLERLERVADECGYGNVTLRLWFHDGQPRKLDVLAREETYHLGKTGAPLTGT